MPALPVGGAAAAYQQLVGQKVQQVLDSAEAIGGEVSWVCRKWPLAQ